MSTSICTSCLARLRLCSNTTASITAPSRIPSTSTSFHTSAKLQNVIKKKSVVNAGARAPKLRESRSARIKKKGKERPKPPAIGQRAIERKRIVLSNTNALPVQDLENLTAANMADPSKTGHVLALDGPLLDQLREAKAFKTTQNWNLFRAPSTLMRQESTDLGTDIEMINKSKGSDGPAIVQKLVLGDKASGKSIHLLQAMSMAYLNKWVVINIPDCQEFVINNSAYAPAKKDADDQSSEQLYNHPQLAADLLTRIVHSNADVLGKLKLNHTHSKTIMDAKPKTLQALAKLGTDSRAMAPSVWRALWKELTEPVEKAASSRPPVLVAIDGINHWMGQTKYRSAEYEIIHAHQFTLIKQFLDLLFSKSTNALGYGGMIIAATTKSNHPLTPAFDLVTRQIQAKQEGIAITDPKFPLGDPYTKQPDDRVAGLFDPASQTTVTGLNGLTRPESKGLLEYFAKSGIFRDVVDDTAVSEKWTMSGGGIIGELCKLGARSRTSMFATSHMEGVPIRG